MSIGRLHIGRNGSHDQPRWGVRVWSGAWLATAGPLGFLAWNRHRRC